MWLKITGAFLLLLCGGLWAEGRTYAEQAALSRVTAFCELFSRLQERIEGLCLPLDEILASLPPSLLGACGCEEIPPALAALCRAMERVGGDAGEILTQAASQLGRGTREDQVRLCRTAAERLRACRDEMAAELARERRARRTLTLCAALSAVILLW